MAAHKPNTRELRKHDRDVLKRQADERAQLREAQSGRRKRDNIIAISAGVVSVALATTLGLTAFAGDPSAKEFEAAKAAASAPASSPASTPAPQETNVGNIPNASVAKGKTFTGTLTINKKPIGVELDGTKAPQAVAVFKTLADQKFFDMKDCHRLTTEGIFVLQCGSTDGKGGSDPNFQWGPVENVPADGKYPAGTIAVARADSTYSNGSQFFIVYKDSVLPVTTGGYTIMGKVTSGLNVITDIAAKGATSGGKSVTDGTPVAPALVESFNLK